MGLEGQVPVWKLNLILRKQNVEGLFKWYNPTSQQEFGGESLELNWPHFGIITCLTLGEIWAWKRRELWCLHLIQPCAVLMSMKYCTGCALSLWKISPKALNEVVNPS